MESAQKPGISVKYAKEFEYIETSDGSGMEKVGFGRVRVYQNFQMSGSGMSGIGKVGFGRVLKFWVSGIFG